jgi:GNAT superfamily N-acetyltransferase
MAGPPRAEPEHPSAPDVTPVLAPLVVREATADDIDAVEEMVLNADAPGWTPDNLAEDRAALRQWVMYGSDRARWRLVATRGGEVVGHMVALSCRDDAATASLWLDELAATCARRGWPVVHAGDLVELARGVVRSDAQRQGVLSALSRESYRRCGRGRLIPVGCALDDRIPSLDAMEASMVASGRVASARRQGVWILGYRAGERYLERFFSQRAVSR